MTSNSCFWDAYKGVEETESCNGAGILGSCVGHVLREHGKGEDPLPSSSNFLKMNLSNMNRYRSVCGLQPVLFTCIFLKTELIFFPQRKRTGAYIGIITPIPIHWLSLQSRILILSGDFYLYTIYSGVGDT